MPERSPQSRCPTARQPSRPPSRPPPRRLFRPLRCPPPKRPQQPPLHRRVTPLPLSHSQQRLFQPLLSSLPLPRPSRQPRYRPNQPCQPLLSTPPCAPRRTWRLRSCAVPCSSRTRQTRLADTGPTTGGLVHYLSLRTRRRTPRRRAITAGRQHLFTTCRAHRRPAEPQHRPTRQLPKKAAPVPRIRTLACRSGPPKTVG